MTCRYHRRCFHRHCLARLCLPGLCLAVAATLPVTSDGFAFEVIGATWKAGSADFWVNPNFPPPDAGDPPDDWTERQVQALRCGARAWTNHTGGDFDFQYRGETDIAKVSADDENVVFYSDQDSNDALATTFFFKISATETMVAFDLVFWKSFEGKDNKWVLGREAEADEFDIWGTATHEFGHALGLGHSDAGPVSEDSGAVMYRVLDGRGNPLRRLREDDVAGLRALYGPREGASTLPTVESVDPPKQIAATDTDYHVRGENFTWASDTIVDLGEVVTKFRIQDCECLIIEELPRNLSGETDVTVTNGLGSATLRDGFCFLPIFLRGDSDRDAVLSVSDPVRLLFYLFVNGEPLPCPDAADADDNGELETADVLRVLLYLFLGGPPPESPFPKSGADETEDGLEC